MNLADIGKTIGERVNEGPALAFFILTLALILGPRLAQRVRLPAMVGLVLAGMVVGSHGLGFLDAKEIALAAMGSLGLLYLMFTAGLELDLRQFLRMKKVALTFAVLSFLIPLTLGILSARFLGYAWAAAILMGSNWSSHTLVTYPMLRQMGLAKNRAVATVVGATAVTDTSALLILTAVSASVKKSRGGLALEGAEILIGLVLLGVWTLWVLPKIARWFFASVGTDRSFRFVFGLAALLSGAVLAQAASIDGIVGAFFAGLGVNNAIPEKSPLMERVQFFGSAWFIPIFLVSVGILLEPKVLLDPRTLLVALVFTIAVLGGKALAAFLAGRIFHFTGAEVGVMSGLSGSQAAATLATTMIGAQLGLFDKTTINAVLVVILVTLVVTPALVTYFGKNVHSKGAESEPLGSSVLVPVWGEQTRPLLEVAARIAEDDGGIVIAASLGTEDAPEDELVAQRRLRDKAEEWLAAGGHEARTLFRVSRSIPAGMLQTLRSEQATLIVTQWRAPRREFFETQQDTLKLVSHLPVPVLITHGDIEPFERMLVIVPPHKLAGRLLEDAKTAVELATRIAKARPVVIVGSNDPRLGALLVPKSHSECVETHDPIDWITHNRKASDLPMVGGLSLAKDALHRLPHLLETRFVVVLSAHKPQPAIAASHITPLSGRSTTEHRTTD